MEKLGTLQEGKKTNIHKWEENTQKDGLLYRNKNFVRII